MGCSSSSTASEDTLHVNTPVRHIGLPEVAFELQDTAAKIIETIPQAYQRLDEEICARESACPGPRLLTAEAWVDHLRTNVASSNGYDEILLPSNKLALDVKVIDFPNATPNGSSSPTELQNSDGARDDIAKVRRLALKMGIALDPTKAARQEEFMARISRSAMDFEAESFNTDMIEHARLRALKLQQSFGQLKLLYLELDNLIASVNNGTYSSLREQQLDSELENAREVRDRLGGVSEQWRTTDLLMRASGKGIQQAVEYWNSVGKSHNAVEKIDQALNCRTACHGSLISLQAALAALPQVEIPFITFRQQSAVKHALIYMLTDMANPSRYQHTKHVLEGFLCNLERATRWVHDTYQETMKKDLSEADQLVVSIAAELREIRRQYMSQRMGSKVYVRPVIRK
ncbi:uncharacterized protein LOC129729676 isoform X1 [Wyeomyia smithii]|uniref:uncharacterized protein LOC129729676 isoform X1 n=1 Tax=Wyeomyia smithii TaxID=174621 RepID=UPI002467B3E3|nr:uncharacterized protein LOC129729676 isoform X1 [Wyeomyia smithii]